MLYRKRHIYILSGLLNLGIGTSSGMAGRAAVAFCSFLVPRQLWRRLPCSLPDFFWEAKRAGLETPWSGQGIYLLAYGALLHFFSGLGKKQRN